MPYLVICLDNPDCRALRLEKRSQHLAYMRRHESHILFGGRLKSHRCGEAIGTSYLLDVESRAGARAFLVDEPYYQSGLFETVSIHAIDLVKTP